MTRAGIGPGTAYPILIRFEREGLISSRWEELPEVEKRPRRRFYRITKQGETAAAFRLGEVAND